MAVAATTPTLWQREPDSGETEIELGAQHFPLLVMRWRGRLEPQHVLRLIRFTDEASERALREGRQLVQICDAREASRPAALVRDMLVDWLNDRRIERAITLSTVVVATDPLVRGLVTSLKWSTGRGRSVVLVGNLEDAVDVGCRTFVRAGQSVPEVLLRGNVDDSPCRERGR